MFTEVGQLVFNRDSLRTNSSEAPRLFRNPESWTTFANMVFLESPVGVGWSSCAASVNGKPCVCNDTSTANVSTRISNSTITARAVVCSCVQYCKLKERSSPPVACDV